MTHCNCFGFLCLCVIIVYEFSLPNRKGTWYIWSMYTFSEYFHLVHVTMRIVTSPLRIGPRCVRVQHAYAKMKIFLDSYGTFFAASYTPLTRPSFCWLVVAQLKINFHVRLSQFLYENMKVFFLILMLLMYTFTENPLLWRRDKICLRQLSDVLIRKCINVCNFYCSFIVLWVKQFLDHTCEYCMKISSFTETRQPRWTLYLETNGMAGGSKYRVNHFGVFCSCRPHINFPDAFSFAHYIQWSI